MFAQNKLLVHSSTFATDEFGRCPEVNRGNVRHIFNLRYYSKKTINPQSDPNRESNSWMEKYVIYQARKKAAMSKKTINNNSRVDSFSVARHDSGFQNNIGCKPEIRYCAIYMITMMTMLVGSGNVLLNDDQE